MFFCHHSVHHILIYNNRNIDNIENLNLDNNLDKN